MFGMGLPEFIILSVPFIGAFVFLVFVYILVRVIKKAWKKG
jgi:hypothetical protein